VKIEGKTLNGALGYNDVDEGLSIDDAWMLAYCTKEKECMLPIEINETHHEFVLRSYA
jgi:hypothetical protein